MSYWNYLSYSYWFPNSDLPSSVSISDLKKGDYLARKTLCESMSTHGYAILSQSEEDVKIVRNGRQSVSDFFDKPEEYKKKFELPPYSDPLLRGQKKNRGYMPQTEKEYLKIRLKDDKSEYPPEVYEPFSSTMNYLYHVAYLSLMRLAQGPIEDSPPFQNIDPPSNTTLGGTKPQISNEDKDPRRWLLESTFKSVKDYIPEGSSMSVIRYFKMNDSDSTINCPCDEHFDTGIVTMILVSEVPGLEVLDQASNKWIQLEKLGKPGDLVIIMGRKIDLLKSDSAILKPTFHRVQIPKNVMRHSILFFMDLPSGPDKD